MSRLNINQFDDYVNRAVDAVEYDYDPGHWQEIKEQLAAAPDAHKNKWRGWSKVILFVVSSLLLLYVAVTIFQPTEVTESTNIGTDMGVNGPAGDTESAKGITLDEMNVQSVEQESLVDSDNAKRVIEKKSVITSNKADELRRQVNVVVALPMISGSERGVESLSRSADHRSLEQILADIKYTYQVDTSAGNKKYLAW